MAELILYACPVGPLADAIEAYWAEVLATIGSNAAHDYMPHVTLTGFFHDEASTIDVHLEAVRRLLALSPPPADVVTVTGALFEPSHHLLTVTSVWGRALAAEFGAATPGVRLKDQLHISLAYGFQPTDGSTLERLGTAMVEPFLPAAWELRFYERRPDRTWRPHGCWPL